MHGDATRRRRHLTALYRSYSPSARRLCPHCASETTPHTDTPRLRLNQMCACNCAAVVSRCVCWGGGEMRKWAHWRRQMLACTANMSLGGAGCRDDGKKQTACYGGVGETQQAHAPDGCAEDTCERGRQQQHHCGSAAHARLRAPGHCLSRRSSARRMEQGQGQLGHQIAPQHRPHLRPPAGLLPDAQPKTKTPAHAWRHTLAGNTRLLSSRSSQLNLTSATCCARAQAQAAGCCGCLSRRRNLAVQPPHLSSPRARV